MVAAKMPFELNYHNQSMGLIIAVFGPSQWKCIVGVNGQNGEGIIGFWCLMNLVLVFGLQTVVQSFIEVN